MGGHSHTTFALYDGFVEIQTGGLIRVTRDFRPATSDLRDRSFSSCLSLKPYGLSTVHAHSCAFFTPSQLHTSLSFSITSLLARLGQSERLKVVSCLFLGLLRARQVLPVALCEDFFQLLEFQGSTSIRIPL